VRLLVSVATADEARAAMAGGADVIDAKDPSAGALGPVALESLCAICAVVNGERPLTAALGDVDDETAIERATLALTSAGAALVKIGFAGIHDLDRVAALIAAAVSGASRGEGSKAGVVAVAYADADGVGAGLGPFVPLVARAGARGVLLDTVDKNGPGLRDLVPFDRLAAWVADAHQAGLQVAIAGRLTVDDLQFVSDTGADIAGVRGAACDLGRNGRVSAEKVRLLRARCLPESPGYNLTSRP
jgi:uncharacterized protein (UPF0264 family)